MKAVVVAVRAEDVPFMAGAIAYQAFVSLLPLLVLVVVVAATEGHLPASTQSLVVDVVRASAGRTGASLIGLVTLSWGAFKIFRGLDLAFSELFDTERKSDIVDSLRDGAVVSLALVVAVLAMVAAGSAFAFVTDPPLGGLLPPVALLAGLVVAFLPMYYVFPDCSLSAGAVVPGAVLAALGWAALEGVFQYYVALAGTSDAYGVLGAVLVLVTWLYFGGLLLLLGATLNAVLAGRAGGPPESPADPPDEADDPVASVRAFREALDDAVADARQHGVSEDALVAVLRRRVESPADVWAPDDRGDPEARETADD